MIPLSSVLLTAMTIIQYVGMYMTVKAGAEGLSSAAENWRAPQVPQYSLQSPVDYINTVISLASAGATAYQSYKGKEGMKSEIKQIVGEEIKQVYDKIDEVEKDLRDEGNKRFDELKKDKRGLEETIRDEMVRNNYYRLVTSILDIMEKSLPEIYRGRIFKFQALLNTHPARSKDLLGILDTNGFRLDREGFEHFLDVVLCNKIYSIMDRDRVVDVKDMMRQHLEIERKKLLDRKEDFEGAGSAFITFAPVFSAPSLTLIPLSNLSMGR